MPNGDGSLDRLTTCLKACKKNDQACVDACEAAFEAEGGKVFTDPNGGKVFTDPQGGQLSIAEGGKVF
jgi:hypothetical protein